MLGGQSLARRGIALLRTGGADPVVVVTGAAGPGRLDAPAADAGAADEAGPVAATLRLVLTLRLLLTLRSPRTRLPLTRSPLS